jgi:hypothetical protein
MGFWIGWLDLLHLIHSHNSGLQAIQHYPILHTFQFTVPHSLGFSVFISRILATDLWLSHWHFKSRTESSFCSLIPFLALILRLPILKTQHNSIPLLPSSYPGRLVSWDSTRLHFSMTLSHLVTVSFYNPLARTTQKTQPLLLRRRVYWSVT